MRCDASAADHGQAFLNSLLLLFRRFSLAVATDIPLTREPFSNQKAVAAAAAAAAAARC